MFEIEILLANIVVPAAVMLVVMFATLAIPKPRRSPIWRMLATAAGVLAVWLAFSLRNGFSVWPDDAWQRIPSATWIVALVALVVARSGSTPSGAENALSLNEQAVSPETAFVTLLKFAAVSGSAAIAAQWIFPRGEGWDELQNQQIMWLTAISLAVGLAWLCMANCHPQVSAMVGLSVIPILVAAAFLTSLSFMKVTEPLLAVATVLGLVSLADLWLAPCRALPTLIAPLVLATAAILAHGQFYNFLDIPKVLYVLAMFSPAAVAFTGRALQQKSLPTVFTATIGVALSLASGIAAWAHFAS